MSECSFSAIVNATPSFIAQVYAPSTVSASAEVGVGISLQGTAALCQPPAITIAFWLLESGGILLLESGNGLQLEG